MIHFKLIDWMQCFRTSVSGSWNEFLLQGEHERRGSCRTWKKTVITDVVGDVLGLKIRGGFTISSLGLRFCLLSWSLGVDLFMPAIFVAVPSAASPSDEPVYHRLCSGLAASPLMLISMYKFAPNSFRLRPEKSQYHDFDQHNSNLSSCFIRPGPNAEDGSDSKASDSSVTQGGENPATFSKQPWRKRIEEWKKRLYV
ncbi:hypothetical protein NC653_011458 [Populus alba x Populus x berolinensis]|uniref:Uncharacterized protein n=1 Tax=Populus alba x Populus x berolinensis TaxID=444605 RepID=A0AAD6R2J4_9ROSI|nr:hypothetical protein NC653_011458 [Populus alba x Populus x berolinensis]